MFISLQGILRNGERTQVAFAVKGSRREASSAGKRPGPSERPPLAAAAPLINTDVMTLSRLIKSAALGPATPHPRATASFFNYILI